MKQKNNIIQGALKILLGSRQKQFRELAAKWLFEGSREHGTPHAEAHLCYQILRPHVHYKHFGLVNMIKVKLLKLTLIEAD